MISLKNILNFTKHREATQICHISRTVLLFCVCVLVLFSVLLLFLLFVSWTEHFFFLKQLNLANLLVFLVSSSLSSAFSFSFLLSNVSKRV